MANELITTANANIRTNGHAPWLLVWVVRVGLATGVAASVFANAMHARPDVIARGIAAWAPLAFFLIVELLSRMPAERSFPTFVRYVGAAVVGGVAAWVSYFHMVAVAAKYGEQYPHLLPLSVDGLIVVTSMCLFELKRRPRTSEANKPAAQPANVTAPTGPVFQYAKPIGPNPAPKPRTVPARPEGKRPAGRPARADKAQHVAAVLAGEKSAAAVARDLHLEPRTVQKWVEAARAVQVGVNGHEFHADGPAEVAAN